MFIDTLTATTSMRIQPCKNGKACRIQLLQYSTLIMYIINPYVTSYVTIVKQDSSSGLIISFPEIFEVETKPRYSNY